MRDLFLKGRVKCSKEDAEETIALFNRVATFVNKALPQTGVEALPEAEVLDLQFSPSFQQLSEVEKEFISGLTPKNLGHLIGDSFILGMTDRWGGRLEGNTMTGALKFLLNAIEYLPTKYPEKFAGKEAELAQAKQLFSQLLESSDRLERIEQETDPDKQERQFSEFVSQTRDQLSHLKEGETLLLPWGWSDPSKIGHAMLLSCTRRNGELWIEATNTGSGTEFHEVPQEAGFRINTVCHYRIPAEKEEDFYDGTLSALFEPRILGGLTEHDSVMDMNERYSAEELYLMLEPYRSQPWGKYPQTESLRGEQQSGTCSLRCYFDCFGRMTSSDFRKEFKFLWEQEVVSQLLQYGDHFVASDPVYVLYLNRMNPNLFRHLDKLRKQGLPETESLPLLEKFERQQKEIEALTFPSEEQGVTLSTRFEPRWPGTYMRELWESGRKRLVEGERPSESQSQEMPEGVPPLLQAEQLATLPPEQLLEILDASALFFSEEDPLLDEIKSSGTQWKFLECTIPRDFFLGEQCRQIARLFTDPALENQRRVFLEQLKDSPELVDAFLERFSKLSGMMTQPILQMDLRYPLALEGLRLAIYDLAVLRDDQQGLQGTQRIDHYALHFEMDLKKVSLSAYTFNTPQAEREYRHLQAAYAQRFPDPKQPRLCHFTEWETSTNKGRGGSSLSIPYSNRVPDFQYAARWITSLKEEDQDKAHQDYLKAIKKGYGSSAKEEEWRVCWMVAHGKLPLSYRALLTASLGATRVAPTSDKELSSFPNALSVTVDLSTVFLEIVSTDKENPNYLSLMQSAELTPTENALIHFPGMGSDKNSIPLHPQKQNEGTLKHDPKLREIIAILSVEHPLQLTMALDFYRQSPELLLQTEHRILFESLFFAPTKLSEALKKNPAQAQEITRFFEELSTLLTLKKIALTDPQEILSLHAFILEQKVHAYQILEASNPTEKKLPRVRAEIETLLNHELSSEPEIGVRLMFAYIGTFTPALPSDHWSPEEIPLILNRFHEALRLLSMSEAPKNLGTTSYLRAAGLILEQQETIERFIASSQSRAWVESLVPGQSVTEWSITSFPILSVQTPQTSQEPQSIDLLTGKNLTSKTDNTGLIPADVARDKSYRAIFQNKRVPATHLGDHYLVKHSTGTYKVWPHMGIEKEIEGKRHLLLPPKKLGIEFFPHVDEWQLWLDIETEPPKVLSSIKRHKKPWDRSMKRGLLISMVLLLLPTTTATPLLGNTPS